MMTFNNTFVLVTQCFEVDPCDRRATSVTTDRAGIE